MCVIGPGVVLDPKAFFEELDMLEEAGIQVRGNLFVSNRAPPDPALSPGRRESSRGGARRQEDRDHFSGHRTGLRGQDRPARPCEWVDLFDAESLRETIFELTREKNCLIQSLYGGPPLDARQICKEYLQ